MPTSGVSGMLSTSAYFTSVFLLVVVVMVPVANLSRSASMDAAERLAQGIAHQVDNLSPGMETMVEFGSYPGMVESVRFSGSNVTAVVDGFSASQKVDWPLENCTLGPNEEYLLWVSGGVVALA